MDTLGQGRFLKLVRRDGWEYVDRIGSTGIVAVVAVTGEGRMILVEQFRPALGRRVLELPAGLAGDVPGQPEEDLSEAARRELLEETGYEAEGFERLFEGPPSAGLCTEVVTFFRARGLRRVGPGGGDGGECIQVHEVALEEVPGWLEVRAAEGILVDPKVYAGLYFARVERGHSYHSP